MDATDLDPDPIVQFAAWFADVVASAPAEPSSVVVATVDGAGRPSARTVLLKGFDADGFVFYTNYESRKGSDLTGNANVCLLFPWVHLRRQVVVLGIATRTTDAESDEYFATRARGSQLGAWASEQSRPVPDRAELDRRFAAYAATYEGGPVPRPPHWGGFRVTPSSIEFWSGRDDRLHDRIRFDRDTPAGLWRTVRLSP